MRMFLEFGPNDTLGGLQFPLGALNWLVRRHNCLCLASGSITFPMSIYGCQIAQLLLPGSYAASKAAIALLS